MTERTLLDEIAYLQEVLPGWWWRVGTCYLSDDAMIGPDYNDPAHRERLLAAFPTEIFDHDPFDIDKRPPGNLGAALREITEDALKFIQARTWEKTT